MMVVGALIDLLLGNRSRCGEMAGWFDGIWTQRYCGGTYQSVPVHLLGLICKIGRSGLGWWIVCSVDLVINYREPGADPCCAVYSLGEVTHH
jgi:hypothetical protein